MVNHHHFLTRHSINYARRIKFHIKTAQCEQTLQKSDTLNCRLFFTFQQFPATSIHYNKPKLLIIIYAKIDLLQFSESELIPRSTKWYRPKKMQ